MKKIKAITRFQFALLFANKTSFIYTLLFPVGYLLYMLATTQNHSTDTMNSIVFLSPYLSYIIVGAVLNGWISNLISTRENNFLKVFTSIVGDKKYILFSNFIVVVLSSLVQILLFCLFFFVMTKSFSLLVLTMALIVAISADVIVALGSVIFLFLRVPVATMSIYLTGYLLFGLLLLNVQTNNLIFNIILNTLDAYYFVTTLVLNLGDFMVSGQVMSTNDVLAILVVMVLYSLLGGVLINKIPISSRYSRA
ncbi:hypothetical protein EQG49_12415 [Periweissella cryptocerci]|uniref:Uncharacterized protein n=1 Tax=Periweissella cryptocerci TaxID=2506420 RepID=A0A4P6YWM8_9LACO|nr:hypothetical protein [Periweissella cryptocerci]QBO37201.1 hypothetical protein EQG49_12415 [Periweissella cryptocerci]